MSWNFELVAGSFGSPLDGPVWDGAAMLFTSQALPANSVNNRILRYDPASGETTDFRRWTNQTIGLGFVEFFDLRLDFQTGLGSWNWHQDCGLRGDHIFYHSS